MEAFEARYRVKAGTVGARWNVVFKQRRGRPLSARGARCAPLVRMCRRPQSQSALGAQRLSGAHCPAKQFSVSKIYIRQTAGPTFASLPSSGVAGHRVDLRQVRHAALKMTAGASQQEVGMQRLKRKLLAKEKENDDNQEHQGASGERAEVSSPGQGASSERALARSGKRCHG